MKLTKKQIVVGGGVGILTLISSLFFFKKPDIDRFKFKMEMGLFREETFLPLDITSTNLISNRTDKPYLDTIVQFGLQELGFDNKIAVVIRPISDRIKENFDSSMTLEAHLMGKNSQYMLFIDEMGRDAAIKVISHELIHLKQYQSGDLVLAKDYVIFKGKKYYEFDIYEMKYERRPWEAEAYLEQKELYNKLYTKLYGK